MTSPDDVAAALIFAGAFAMAHLLELSMRIERCRCCWVCLVARERCCSGLPSMFPGGGTNGLGG